MTGKAADAAADVEQTRPAPGGFDGIQVSGLCAIPLVMVAVLEPVVVVVGVITCDLGLRWTRIDEAETAVDALDHVVPGSFRIEAVGARIHSALRRRPA